MKFSRSTSLAIAILIAWLILAWKLGSALRLHAPVLYYFWAGLWLIGIAGFIGYFYLRPSESVDTSSDAAKDVAVIFAEATQRMRTAQSIKRLGSLPTVFLLGDSGSAKTSILSQSGLEPELLAGAAYQDYLVTPTRSLNLWYSHQTIFVDPAGALIGDEPARRKLFKSFAPGGFDSAFSSKQPPARSVVLTVDTETFLQSGSAQALTAQARQYHTILAELSAELGSSFPVYVLFTKVDKIAYFRDFAENLTDPETLNIFGAALPVKAANSSGVYAEVQTRRLTNAFQELFDSLADLRPSYLAREHDPIKLPNIYEFPREFAKLRPLLVQFLVDLCRPNQLGTVPFLRGFYFTGIRQVNVTDLAPAMQTALIQEGEVDPGATFIFNPRSKAPSALVEQSTGISARRVPQWVFLSHLFLDVILADQPATAVAQQNVKVSFARRIAFASVIALVLLVAGWLTVSYTNNKALVEEASKAARSVPSASLSSGQLASPDALRQVTHVRDTLDMLNRYDQKGVPFHYGAFLYTGQAVRQPLHTTYYALFRKLLLAPTQETLAGISAKPELHEAQGYNYIYDVLKAYLITTDHHDKSTVDFLAPVLTQHWAEGQNVDNERQYLARRNFEFYAGELVNSNPFPAYAKPDSTAVANARAFLKKFKQEDRTYQTLLAAAGRGQKPLVFNADYPGSAETVLNTYRVHPAFTQSGSTLFAKALDAPATYFGGEDWVLGEPVNPAQDRQKLKSNLAQRYENELVKTWREYLQATSIVPFSSVPDAANKLSKLKSPDSPLLRVLCVASEHTKSVPQAFQPVQSVTPPGCSSKLVDTANKAYMQDLISLQAALQAVGPIEKADPASIAAANNAASEAEKAVSGLALSFTPDPANPKSIVLPKTEQILRDPIIRVPLLLKQGIGAAANAAAKATCESVNPLLSKYPFNPKSQVDASLQEINDFLKPNDGKLWLLYNQHLKQYLVPAGNNYVRVPGQQAVVTDAFLRFFNRAAHMSQMMYKSDAQPNLSFSIQALPSPDVTHVTLGINGQTLSTDLKSGSHSQTFAWPGTAAAAYLGVSFGGGTELEVERRSGLWAIWRMIGSAEHLPDSNGQMQIQWTETTKSGGITYINGHPASVKFALDAQSSQIFRPQYFSGIGCTATALTAVQ